MVYLLNEKLRNDEFLGSLIDQIYINSLGELELSPKLGPATILIGDLNHLDEKLLHLKAFYVQKGLSSELAEYRLVNLKFRNQIVCTKR
jgi:cell division protein FtsQ